MKFKIENVFDLTNNEKEVVVIHYPSRQATILKLGEPKDFEMDTQSEEYLLINIDSRRGKKKKHKITYHEKLDTRIEFLKGKFGPSGKKSKIPNEKRMMIKISKRVPKWHIKVSAKEADTGGESIKIGDY